MIQTFSLKQNAFENVMQIGIKFISNLIVLTTYVPC